MSDREKHPNEPATDASPSGDRAADDAELRAARAKIDALEGEVRALRGRVAAPTGPRQSGKTVVIGLLALIIAALSTAMIIWVTVRKPWADKKLPPPPPATETVDVTGRGVILALQKCVSAVPETEPVSVKLRVKVGSDGSTAVVEANIQPDLEVLVPCARQSASEVHPPRGDRDFDVLITYEATREPAYRRMARWNWSAVEMNNTR